MKKMLVPLVVLLMGGMVGAVGTPRGTKQVHDPKTRMAHLQASELSDAALTVAAARDDKRPKHKPSRVDALKAKHKASLKLDRIPDLDGIKPGDKIWMSKAPIKNKEHAAAVIKSPRAHSPAKGRSDSSVTASPVPGGSVRSRSSSPGKGVVDAAAMETADRADLTNSVL